jgi:hypothetical protein
VPLGAITIPKLNYYPGESTEITYSNGKIQSVPVQAVIFNGLWSPDIVDGDSFTNFFCIAPAQESSSSSQTASATASSTATSSASPSSTQTLPSPLATMFGHPYPPVFKDLNDAVAGYFLNGSDYQDTAVLYVASFANDNFANKTTIAPTFVNTTRDFLAAAVAANKTKLVIDMSGNGGGNTLLPNDLVSSFVPTLLTLNL